MDEVAGRCPACTSARSLALGSIESAPVLCNALWDSPAAARGVPRRAIALTLCRACGLIYNARFDPGAIAYSAAYDNSLHFSPAFQRFADGLAARLVERFDLHGRRIIEIGCGNGEFLAALCALGGNEGIGYDPSYDPARARQQPQAEAERLRILDRPFPDPSASGADFVCCRHVIEHVPDPASLVASVCEGVGRGGAGVYFEAPDAGYMLEQRAIWDVIYEHHTYFTVPALRSLFARHGFGGISMGTDFGGQYLWLEARTGEGAGASESAALPAPEEIAAIEAQAAAFARDLDERVASWGRRLVAMQARGRVAVWGVGSKGAMFLNLVPGASGIEHVVDVNPNKHGKYVPGGGQRIDAPESLREARPSTVIAMNPLYEAEIRQQLDALGLDADLYVAT